MGKGGRPIGYELEWRELLHDVKTTLVRNVGDESDDVRTLDALEEQEDRFKEAREFSRAKGMILQVLDSALKRLTPSEEESFYDSAGDASSHSPPAPKPAKIFIGHGRSRIWKDLKDFVADRLHLDWDEFNRESAAGIPTTERLQKMLQDACFALIVMTGEDEHADGSLQARPNVIHEIGLFQGRLGFKRAIVLLEKERSEFSNLTGLTQIRFPKGAIESSYEEIRRVMEREGLLTP